MTINKEWRVVKAHADPSEDDLVAIVEWSLTFTDEENFPGVSTMHGGKTPVDAEANIKLGDADMEDLLLQHVQDYIEPMMGRLEGHHAEMLAARHLEQRATASEDLRDLEAQREAMTPLSPRQIRLALASIEISESDVDTALEDNPEGEIEWKHATQFERTHPMVTALADEFELPGEQVDSLWTWAAEI